MELILNLIWLILALPAYLIWQRRSFHGAGSERFRSLRCILVLHCSLILLFPIVSVSDDLRAMRTEIEESGPSERAVKNAGNHSISPAMSGPNGLPVSAISADLFPPRDTILGLVFTPDVTLPYAVLLSTHSGRAPPPAIA